MSLKARILKLEREKSTLSQAPEEVRNSEILSKLEAIIGKPLPHTAEQASSLLGYSASVLEAAAFVAGFSSVSELLAYLEVSSEA